MVEKELGGKEHWLWLPEVHEPRHGGERDCCPRLSPAGAPLPAARTVAAVVPRQRAAGALGPHGAP